MANVGVGRPAARGRAVSLSPQLRWALAGVVVGVMLALGFAIRQPSQQGLAPVDGFYSPNVQYGPWYIANNYRLYDSASGVPRVSNYTSGLIYGAINYTYTFVDGAALVLSGARDVAAVGRLYLLSPWQGLLLMPLAALALYGWTARAVGAQMQPAAVAILYALAALPNYPMVSWASTGGFATPLGWAIFFGIYLAILGRTFGGERSWQWSVVMVICLLLLQPTYHTAALALTIFLVSLWAVQRRVVAAYLRRLAAPADAAHPADPAQPFLRTGTIQLTVVIFLSFLLYHAVLLFNDYGRIFFRFLADVYRSDDHERLKYSVTGTDISPLWHVVNYAAVLVPVALLAAVVARRRFDSRRDAMVALYPLTWLVALGPLVVLLYAWDGLFGVYARMLQYGTLLAIASAALLAAARPQLVRWLALAALVCVGCSSYLTVRLGVTSSNALTADEYAAAVWVREGRGCDHVIFTDYRIGTTLGYQGCFAVVGPTAGGLSRSNAIDRLAALLYDGDPARLAATVDLSATADGRRPDTILLSRRFLDPQVGFVLPDTRLRPMTEAQWAAYRAAPGWRVAYENGGAAVLVREPR